jgi:hypothetical protein
MSKNKQMQMQMQTQIPFPPQRTKAFAGDSGYGNDQQRE